LLKKNPLIKEKILLSEFDYDLPEKKIAQVPVPERDSSKLLFYNKGDIMDKNFRDLPHLIAPNSSLFFNDTRVVNARLLVNKESGALIEIFLIEPFQPAEVSHAMTVKNNCIWKCLIGNLKKWKGEPLKLNFAINDLPNTLVFKLLDREKGLVEFHWQQEISFSEVLNQIGNLPLPPYLNRKLTDEDKIKYQTVYSVNQGGVAAPTAGLHFTSSTLDQLHRRLIQTNFLTLHVNAGTFKPVTVENITNHPIHQEEN